MTVSVGTRYSGNEKKRESSNGLRTLSLLMWMPWGRASLFIGTATINLLALVLPLVILQTYDRILPNKSTDTLFLLISGVALSLALDAILRIARADLVGRAGARFVHFMKCEAVQRMLGAPISDYEKDEPGVHLERLSALDGLRDHHTGQAMIALVDLPFAFIFLALIAYIGGNIVWIPVAIFLIFAVFALFLGKYLRGVIKDRSKGEDRRHAFIIEALSGIHTIKAQGMEALMCRRYERLLESNAGTAKKTFQIGARAQEFGAVAAQLTILGIAIAGSVSVIDGTLTVGALVACTLLGGRSLQPLMRGLSFWTQLQNLSVAADQTAETFALPAEAEEKATVLSSDIAGNIEAANLSFQYGSSDEEVVNGIDIQVSAGEIIGITGGSGTGKSTFLWLLAGLLQPTSGRIKFDGYDISQFDPRSVRKVAAYLPQKPELFSGTVMENLTGFRKGEAEDTAIRLAEQLGLDEKIALLPGGYETQLGDTTAESLPAGTRQQIAIVRSLVTRPAIILFDEANSNLDSQDDARLRDTLATYRGRSTVVMVSHRPSMLGISDRVFRLSSGRLYPADRNGIGPRQAPPVGLEGTK